MIRSYQDLRPDFPGERRPRPYRGSGFEVRAVRWPTWVRLVTVLVLSALSWGAVLFFLFALYVVWQNV